MKLSLKQFIIKLAASIIFSCLSVSFSLIQALDENPVYALCSNPANYSQAKYQYSSPGCKNIKCAEPFNESIAIGTPTNWEAYGYRDQATCAASKYLPNYYEIIGLSSDILTVPDPTSAIKTAIDTALMRKAEPGELRKMASPGKGDFPFAIKTPSINELAAEELRKRLISARLQIGRTSNRATYNQLLSNSGIKIWTDQCLDRFLTGAYARSVSAFAAAAQAANAAAKESLAKGQLRQAEENVTAVQNLANDIQRAADKIPTEAASQTLAQNIVALAATVKAEYDTAVASSGSGAGGDTGARITELTSRVIALKDQALEDLKNNNLHAGEKKLLDATEIMLEAKNLADSLPKATSATLIKDTNIVLESAMRRILKEFSQSDIRADFERLTKEVEREIANTRTITDSSIRAANINTIDRKIEQIKSKIAYLSNNQVERNFADVLKRNLQILGKTKQSTTASEKYELERSIQKEINDANRACNGTKSELDNDIFGIKPDGSADTDVSRAISTLMSHADEVLKTITTKEITPAMELQATNFVNLTDNIKRIDFAITFIDGAFKTADKIRPKISNIEALLKAAKTNIDTANLPQADTEIKQAINTMKEIQNDLVKKLSSEDEIRRLHDDITKFVNEVKSIADNSTIFPIHGPTYVNYIKDLATNLQAFATRRVRLLTNPPTIFTIIAETNQKIADTRRTYELATTGGGTAESKDGSGGGAGDSTGAGTGTGTSGGGGSGGGTGAGTGASEIDRLLRIAEQAAGAVTTALMAGNLDEAERQAKIINDLLDAARTTGDDTGKLRRILKISKDVKTEIDGFKAAHAGAGGGGGGSSTGTSTGTGGGAGTSKPAGKPAGNLDDLQRELTRLYQSRFNTPLEPISLRIQNILFQVKTTTGDLGSYLRSLNQDLLSPTDNSVIKLLRDLRTDTTMFFVGAQANYQWPSGDVANFSKIQDSLNGVAQNIRDLYQQIEDTALERVAIAVGVSELRVEIRGIERLIADAEAVPTSTDIYKLENLKQSIDRVKAAAAKQLATNLQAAEKSSKDIQSADITYLNTLKPLPVFTGNLTIIAEPLTEIVATVQRRFTTKLDRDLDALKTRIEAIRARIIGGSTGAGGGAAGTSSFDKIQRDIKRDFDTNFILSRAEEDWTRPGIIGLFTMLVELRPLRPILDKMANLLRALETKRASAPVASLSASERASIDQLYSNLVIIRDSLNGLLFAANETLSQRLTVGPLFKNAEDLRHAAYSGFMGTSTDSEAVTYQKIQAFVRALDSLEPYSASLEAAKNRAVKYATDAIANIRAISGNNGWLNINTSNLNAWNSRTAWMDLGDGLRNIVQAPYDKLQDLRTTRDNQFNPWLAAHASAAAGASAGGGASTGTGAGDAGAVPLPEFRHEYQKLLADKHNVQNLIAVYISFNNTGKNNKAITFAIGALVTPGVKATVDTVNAELRKLITAAGGTVPAI